MESRTEPFKISELVQIIREIYLGRETAFIEIRHSTGMETLFFREGELHLDRDHIAASRIQPLLEALPENKRPASEPKLRDEVEWLARELTTHHATEGVLSEAPPGGVELVGPLPTVSFLTELAVHGCDEEELLRRLGGVEARFSTSDKTPALQQLPGLEPNMNQAMVHLERETSAGDLLRGAGTGRLGLLRGMAKLWAVGLVVRTVEPESNDEVLLTPRVLMSFSGRIVARLEAEPLELDTDEHRARVAELLGKLGKLNHYELLGIEPRADEQEISSAYNRLAMVVHPSHAKHLGFEGKEEAIRVVFERVTEAYLTLSDPRRRASYNTMAGITVGPQVADEQREQEKRDLARQNYLRASNCFDQMEYSRAVDLLKEAVRMDPQPEYLARLGIAQSKNPHWLQHAVTNFERALEMRPDDAGIHLAFGNVLEELDRFDEARREYHKAVELMPDNTTAQDGLERLGGAITPVEGADFKSLFNRAK